MSFLKHYGTKRHSGRYPWGSGNNPEQRNKSFLGYIKKLQDEGMSEVEVANAVGMTTSQLRARKSIARSEVRRNMATQAQKLKAKGMSNIAIGERMGINESSVRALLNPSLQEKADIATATAGVLRKHLNEKGLLDVGSGVESHLGITRTKLDTALQLLKEEGYKVQALEVEQVGTGKMTRLRVLTPESMTYSELLKTYHKDPSTIKSPVSYSEDGGLTYKDPGPLKNIDSKRIHIRYDEDGGSNKDGVIELRRGVDDISLGASKYAQVRIGVDGTHYLKGMAMYADDLPKGVDIIYNTNKKKGTPPEEVFKPMKDDPENPFGSSFRPKHYIDKDGNEQRSVLNIVNEEGKWGEWSRNISSQVLSKQTPALAKRQLDLARDIKLEEFDEISSITNPVVKKALLKSFSDDLDASAVHLKAAALPRQSSHVILPINSLKETEVYAPNYKNGERVVLIRHPHGGIFEIPELVVNNKNPEANSVMKNALDAIGIHPKVAEKLSGADFDGDTVLVIPNKDRLIKTAPTLKELENFNPKALYKLPKEAPKMSNRTKQMQMGDVSNLITDMTIKGASASEIARAVKHSMVVIDAEKHHLDYKKSAIDNGIAELKKKYQGGERSGASTLISKASSEKRVAFREEGKKVTDPKTGKTKRVYIDPVTGKKLYQETGDTFVNAKGKTIKKTTATTKLADEDDAFKLSSGTKIESIYAEYSNTLKSLANKARLLMIRTPNLEYSPTAKEKYAPEVARLKAALALANRNKPLERQAQLVANSIVKAKKNANPNMTPEDLKKIKGQALEEARARVGAKKEKIIISPKEWEAIQLGAISHNTLSQIIMNADLDQVKTLATPRTAYKMTDAKTARARTMSENGYTISEIASALGVSTTTIQEVIK